MTRRFRLIALTGLLSLVGLLTHGCANARCPFSQPYGPNFYDHDGTQYALVRITDTNYPAILAGRHSH